jgi:hypothetical protein
MQMAMKSMETAVEAIELIEMAPGALPRPSKVPEQRLLSPEIGLRRRRRCRTFLGKTPIDLGFLLRKALYRRRGGVRGRPGAPHHRGAQPRVYARHPRVWLVPGPPSALLQTLSRVGKNRRFGLRFIQFREYFLCNFSETQK